MRPGNAIVGPQSMLGLSRPTDDNQSGGNSPISAPSHKLSSKRASDAIGTSIFAGFCSAFIYDTPMASPQPLDLGGEKLEPEIGGSGDLSERSWRTRGCGWA